MTTSSNPDRYTQFLTALREAPAVHTAECLSADELIGLVEQGNDHPEFLTLMCHVMPCKFCHAGYKLLKEMAAVEEAYRSSTEPIKIDASQLRYTIKESDLAIG